MATLDSSQEAIKNLLEKMEILSIHNNELTIKLENNANTLEASLVETLETIKNNVATSYLDLIDVNPNSCNQVLIKNVIVETCSNEIAMENELLRKEVACLGKALYDKKDKAKQTQPRQDNTTEGVNKLDKVETVVCWICHKEGHKSYQCKEKIGDVRRKKSNKKDLQYLDQQGG
jgi:DNA-directed RNA polymerase subunit L